MLALSAELFAMTNERRLIGDFNTVPVTNDTRLRSSRRVMNEKCVKSSAMDNIGEERLFERALWKRARKRHGNPVCCAGQYSNRGK